MTVKLNKFLQTIGMFFVHDLLFLLLICFMNSTIVRDEFCVSIIFFIQNEEKKLTFVMMVFYQNFL